MTEGLVEEEELAAEVFHQDELVMIAAPGHQLAGRPRVPLSAVREEPFILREPGSGTRAVEEWALARLKLPVRVVMALGSTEAIKRVVAAGVAWPSCRGWRWTRNVPQGPWPCCQSPGCASRGRSTWCAAGAGATGQPCRHSAPSCGRGRPPDSGRRGTSRRLGRRPAGGPGNP